MIVNLDDSFTKELEADPIMENSRRLVRDAHFSYVMPRKTSDPKLIHVSPEMLEALGISGKEIGTTDFLNLVTGNQNLPGFNPYAMVYAGHQFGNWASQLGDGRAINIAEVLHDQKRWILQLKGAGETPYSRSADGLAVLRSSIREYLCSEAMYHLGVPTTRALSLALTGDQVLRDVMYDGNAAYEKGAIVCRVAPSFLRFGNYQWFASQNKIKELKQLTDYTIKYFFDELPQLQDNIYLNFFQKVCDLTREMITHWQRVGFVHGVMNTDNMSILGLTIDYGPYGWLDDFNPNWTPNTTDRTHKRYRYGNQPNIALWNLYQLANALVPLINETEGFESILNTYPDQFKTSYQNMMRKKLGLINEGDTDDKLIGELVENLQMIETDMTIFFRELAKLSKNDVISTTELVKFSFYNEQELNKIQTDKWLDWFQRYKERLQNEVITDEDRAFNMNLVNPKYVLRNYMAQMAIDEADSGNFDLIDELFQLLKNPYKEQLDNEKWYAKRPDWARDKIGCSMLSCSS
ncbi:protein adenylyltransferase SelO [Aegicerativicinus sediminis]